jgi:hypothetical protein
MAQLGRTVYRYVSEIVKTPKGNEKKLIQAGDDDGDGQEMREPGAYLRTGGI